MAKFYGEIGFFKTVEDPDRPGIWSEVVTTKNYYGEVTRNSRRLQSTSDTTNDNITISNTLSIVADPYANENFHYIKYVKFMGTKWKVTNIEVVYPRLTLTLGEEYHG